MWSVRCQVLLDVVRACTAEDDNIEQRVRTEAICTVHRDAGSLTSGVQARHDLVIPGPVYGDNLASVTGRDTTHCNDMTNQSCILRDYGGNTYCYNGR